MIYFATLLISMITTIVLIPMFTGLAVKLKILDHPGDRKVHEVPIPKAGGISMTLGALIPILLWAPIDSFVQSVLIGAWIVVLFGLLDDFKDLNYKVKFAGQVVAALIVVLYGKLRVIDLGDLVPAGMNLPEFVSIPLTLFIIVGVTNAINLSDGLDGLAGGICLLSFLFIGFYSFFAGSVAVGVFSVAMIGAILGFLRFNTFPAKIFMGDSGSQLLGFIFITMSLKLTQESLVLSPMLPLFLIGLPILDTIIVMAERISEGSSPFHADKKHLHHKILSLGFYHRESVLAIYVTHAFLVTSGFILREKSDWILLAYYCVFSIIFFFSLSLAKQRGWHRSHHQHFIDNVIKGRLRIVKDNRLAIKLVFKLALILITLLLVFSCLLLKSIPDYLTLFSAILLFLVIVTRRIKKEWNTNILRIALFLLMPFIIYIGEINTASWMGLFASRSYNGSFVVLILFVLLTLRLSRREGFQSTPLDFLILFIALVVPNLPDEQIKSYEMGSVAAKIIVLYFSFEVLAGELRSDLGKVRNPIILILIIIVLRGGLSI